MGFEPTTFSLARRRSTPELHPHLQQGWQESNPQPSVLETDALPIELHPYIGEDSGGGIRTPDLQVMSLASCLCSTPQCWLLSGL